MKQVFLIISAFASTIVTAQSVNFVQPTGTPLNTTTAQVCVVSHDLNSDGNKDLIIGNAYGSTLRVMLGNGNGQFSPAPGSPMSSPNGPIYITVANFNSDMIPDFAVANYNGGNISIYLGTGTGSFSPNGSITTGSLPYCIDSKDVNLDGNMDILTVSAGANKAYVFLGSGTGTFTPASGSPITTGTMPYFIATGFFNADAFPDFAVANGNSNNVSIFIGSGTGTFTQAAGSPIATGTQPRTLSLADFNSDGKTDIAVTNLNSNTIRVLLGIGTGSFTPLTPIPTTSPFQSVVGDFDLDGKLDIGVANTTNSVSVFLGQGTGNFTNAIGSPIGVGNNPHPLCASDLNNDGKTDLAIGDFVGSQVFIFLNTAVSQVGIAENISFSNINVYPNPATSCFFVELTEVKEKMLFELHDLLGRKVFEAIISEKKQKLDYGKLPNGIYIYKISDSQKILRSGRIMLE